METPTNSDVNDFKKCPTCGVILETWSHICPSCGYEWRNVKKTPFLRDFFFVVIGIYNLIGIITLILWLPNLMYIFAYFIYGIFTFAEYSNKILFIISPIILILSFKFSKNNKFPEHNTAFTLAFVISSMFLIGLVILLFITKFKLNLLNMDLHHHGP